MKNYEASLQTVRLTIKAVLCLALILSSALADAQKFEEEEKEGKDAPRERQEWFITARAYPDNIIPVNALQNAWEQAQALPIVRPRGTGRGGFVGSDWEFFGPDNTDVGWTCRVNSIAVHPTVAGTLYIGVAKGGLWKSTDSGATWANLTDGLSTQASGCVVLDPTTPSTVYYGTGENYINLGSNFISGLPSLTGVGIFKSTNSGANWTLIGNSTFAGKNINDIVIDPGNANHWIVATNAGIYTTNDGGTTFTLRQAGTAWRVRMHPANTSILYAALNGVYKSTDGGNTWALQTASGLPNGSVGRVELDICKANGNIIYVAFRNPDRVWKTTDGGASWANTTNGASFGGDNYMLVMRVDPTNGNTAYVGGFTLLKTTNGGTSWTDICNPYTGAAYPGNHPDQHAMAFDPANANNIYVGDDGGLKYSSNGGTNWTLKNAGRGTMEYYGFDIHPTVATTLFAGAQDNGLQRRTTNNTYSRRQGGDGMNVAYNFSDPNKVVLSFQNGWLITSSDGGGSAFSSDLTFDYSTIPGERVAWVAPLVNDHMTPTRFYVGTQRVHRSNDNGNTWSPVSPDLTNGTNTLNIITVAPSSSNVVYTGSRNGKLFVSTDASNASPTWTDRSVGLQNASIGGIAVDPTNPAIVYAGHQKYGLAARVYKSTNYGAAWTNITGNLPDTPVNSLLVHPTDSTTLFAATDAGVFVTSDGGATWGKYGTGLPTSYCTMLRANSTHLTASSFGRGMWRVPFTATTQWYVDKVSGLDTNPGTAAAPFKTVNRAIAAASNGHTIYVKQGNYGTDTGRIVKGVRLVNWGNAGLSRIGQP